MTLACNKTDEKINLVSVLLNDLQNDQFTGFIRISFSQGGITKIEKNEDILKKQYM